MNKIATGLMITVVSLKDQSVSTIWDTMLKSGNTMSRDHTCWKGAYTMVNKSRKETANRYINDLEEDVSY